MERRADDDINILENRLKVYRLQTEPVKSFYNKQEKLKVVDGTGTTDEVFERLCNVIDEYISTNKK